MVSYLDDSDSIEVYAGTAVGWVHTASAGTPSYDFVETVYFTSSGTFSKADYPWLRAIRVKCQGGGGAGGGVTSGGSGVAEAGSGSGGGYAESFITDIAGLDATVTVTRGAGGAGVSGGNGNAGESSSFGALVIGDGGIAGNSSNRTTGNAQNPSGLEAGGTGDLVVFSSAGMVGTLRGGVASFQNNSGSSYLAGGVRTGFSFSVVGSGGSFPGGGGSGARNNDATARAGGAGANGIVILELYA
jgi:hypothetical protein